MSTISPGALRTLEFARVVSILESLAVSPAGRRALRAIAPITNVAAVEAAQRATTEVVRFLTTRPGLPLRAPADLDDILGDFGVEGRALEPVPLLALADHLDSVALCRSVIRANEGSFPILERLVSPVASFSEEIADVRGKIDPSGEIHDHATPALAAVRTRLRRERSKLRNTLEAYVRGRDTAKYLQDQVVTDRNGRYVLVVRAEHRGAIPGIVHGASSSGASLYLEPLSTVEINNDIVALEEEEAEEVRRILHALTDRFRLRTEELTATTDAAVQLDVVQARARLSEKLQGTEATISRDGTFVLKGARHPLLILQTQGSESRRVVPVDILLSPPSRVLVIAGPNTGGKTVALKTAGLLVLMAQAGLHIPVEADSSVPVFGSVFADIGDDQSIAASLSTFSAHVTNIVSMDRSLVLPALVLLDEVGAGTDPAEGGALGIAIIDHFRRRGAHLVATTHYDTLKSYATATVGVLGAAFGFSPESFAPTYRLLYGTAGRSLAIEIAARLGMPPAVVAAARNNLSDEQQHVAEHLARLDEDIRKLEAERRQVQKERAEVAEHSKSLAGREEALAAREDALRRRVATRVEDQVKVARREIDKVIDALKASSAELTASATRQLRDSPRLRVGISTGDTGAMRRRAQTAVDAIVGRLHEGAPVETAAPSSRQAPADSVPITAGTRVIVRALGLEGLVLDVSGEQADVDVHGKRLRARLVDLTALQPSASSTTVRVNVDLQPREASSSELNLIGCSVEEALERVERFLDEATVTDRRALRIVHGHGTGQLRRAVGEFLRKHPLVAHVAAAPQNQGGTGATIVEMKD